LKVTGSDKVDFPGKGAVGAETASGTVTEDLVTVLCDITINIKDKVPQSISSYSCKCNNDKLEEATGMDGKKMKEIHTNGMRGALKKIADDVMNKNVKVAINTAIQNWKNSA